MVTGDWYITKDLFSAYKKQKCNYQNVQTCSMDSTYVSTVWICFIIIICMHTLCRLESPKIFSRAGACRSMQFLYFNGIEVVNKITKKR